MSKLLMHACCGPCLIYPHRLLRDEHEIAVFYFNPNIQPSSEYVNRLSAIADYCAREQLPLHIGEYAMERHLRAVAFSETPSERCRQCYGLRLEEAAKFAAENGYETFTTTLTVSPYQDHESIMEAGDGAAARHGVRFVYHDFRDGFREGQELAKELSLYRQAYCGCVYSERERYAKKLERLVGDLTAEKD